MDQDGQAYEKREKGTRFIRGSRSVWDSTSEVRYLVLLMRPLGTDGWSEERLASIVTRDCMIGTGLPTLPDGESR